MPGSGGVRQSEGRLARRPSAKNDLLYCTFTVVMADGSMVTKAERLAGFKTQTAMPVWPRSREVAVRYGDAYVVRFLANGEWFLEVWALENGQWKTAATQVTRAKK